MPMVNRISLKELKKNFHYNPYTGRLTVIVPRRRGASSGDEAGWINTYGYRCVEFEERQYKVHQLVWFYMIGRWQKEAIDHINGNKSDNRFSNLREATREQNSYNVPRRKSNKIGYKGVSIKAGKKENPYVAQIQYGKKKIHIGYFPSAEEAYAAYYMTARKLMGRFAHGA